MSLPLDTSTSKLQEWTNSSGRSATLSPSRLEPHRSVAADRPFGGVTQSNLALAVHSPASSFRLGTSTPPTALDSLRHSHLDSPAVAIPTRCINIPEPPRGHRRPPPPSQIPRERTIREKGGMLRIMRGLGPPRRVTPGGARLRNPWWWIRAARDRHTNPSRSSIRSSR